MAGPDAQGPCKQPLREELIVSEPGVSSQPIAGSNTVQRMAADYPPDASQQASLNQFFGDNGQITDYYATK